MRWRWWMPLGESGAMLALWGALWVVGWFAVVDCLCISALWCELGCMMAEHRSCFMQNHASGKHASFW